MPTETACELVILEFKRISCVTNQYVKRARNVAEAQYASIKSALEQTLNLQGWTVNQGSFIAGARSLNEKELHDNLAYFKVPQACIDSIRPKLAFKIFDEYANILKGMYSTDSMGVQRITTPITRWTPSQEDPYPTSLPQGSDHQVALTTLTYSRTDRTYQQDSIVGCIT
jgi:hypothetical protein